jgi:hypothetical protein
MYNIRDTGVWTGLDYSNPDLYIYNNVFDGSGIASVILFNYDDIRLWNNIFLAPSGSNVIQINAGSAATQLAESNYNLFGESQTCVLGQNGPSPQVYTTLASWQAGTNYDRNSLAGSPTFVNRSRRDYHLAAGSLGIGTGKNGENMGAYRTGSEVIGPGPSVVRPLLQFNAAGYSVDEAGASVTVTVTRTDSSAEAVSVDYATANGSAIAGADYTSTSGTLSWAAGDNTPKGFTVAIADDTDLEGAETVNLTLSNPTGGAALGAPSTAVLTITDDDAPSSVSFSTTSYSVNEDGGSATITVARSGNSSVAATVDYATGNGTALAGADYASASGTLSWAAGDSAPKTFTVALTNDTDVEGDETVGLLLSNPIGAVLGSPANATLTVTDNDTGTPSAPAEQANLGGGCALRGAGELDPTLPLLLGMALAWLGVRSRSAARQQTVY